MNLIALALLISALPAFGAFHFLLFDSPTGNEEWNIRGWKLWREIIDVVMSLSFDGAAMIAIATFLAHSLMVVSFPFIIAPLRSSRWLWWLAAVSSGIALCGFGGFMITNFANRSPGPGFYSLLASLALNFLGLLFIRRETPTTSPPP